MVASIRKNAVLPPLLCFLPLVLALTTSILFSFFYQNEVPAFFSLIRVFDGIAIFGIGVIVLVEIGSHFFNKEAQWTPLFIALSIAVSILTAPDTLTHLFDDPRQAGNEVLNVLLHIANHLSLLLTVYFVLRFLKKNYDVPLLRHERILTYALLIASFITFIPLIHVHFEFLVSIIDIGLAAYWLLKTHVYAFRKGNRDLNLFLVSVILTTVVSTSLCITLSHDFPAHFYATGIASVSFLIIDACFYGVYLSYVVRVTQKANQKEEYEKRIKELQGAVLKQQIRPHFLFNALNAIKMTYKTDPEKGEEAITLFSKYLRASMRAADQYLVPLERELKVVQGYVELESLKTPKPYEVLYNIDAFQFEVPYFGLQPIVENAIQHANLQSKEDGHIEIATYEDQTHYHIKITDNGVGYDINQVKSESIGLTNTKKRFELLLNATLDILSKPGEGCSVNIAIPKGEKDHADDHRG